MTKYLPALLLFGLWLTFGLWAPIARLPEPLYLPLAMLLMFFAVGALVRPWKG